MHQLLESSQQEIEGNLSELSCSCIIQCEVIPEWDYLCRIYERNLNTSRKSHPSSKISRSILWSALKALLVLRRCRIFTTSLVTWCGIVLRSSTSRLVFRILSLLWFMFDDAFLTHSSPNPTAYCPPSFKFLFCGENPCLTSSYKHWNTTDIW